jgi:hypothetical protein
MMCGTSHILRKKLLGFPSNILETTDEQIKNLLGSHVKVAKYLESTETPLLPLPFFGGVYRIGNSDGHSKTPGIFRAFFLKKSRITNPVLFMKQLFNLRILSKSKKKEFGMK